MNRFSALLLDILYPNRCDCCGRRIAFDRDICMNCEETLDSLRYSYAEWAADKQDILWNGGIVRYGYTETAKDGVLAMKDGCRGFGRHAAHGIAAEVRNLPVQFDFVTWVPMDRKRRRRQGYAHAELLGKEIAKDLGILARGDLLAEQGGRIRQHDLPAQERQKYAARFMLTGKRLSGETVLLVDDILTTGSTLRKCTELLKEAGAAQVYIAAVCAGLRAVPAAIG